MKTSIRVGSARGLTALVRWLSFAVVSGACAPTQPPVQEPANAPPANAGVSGSVADGQTAAPPAAARKWSTAFADMVLKRWPDPLTISTKGFEYEPGIVLHGVRKVYEKSGDVRYRDYIKTWVDHWIDDKGAVRFPSDDHNLDFIQPATLILFLERETKDEKYAKAAAWVRGKFASFPVGPAGGYWHKKKYPDEMWSDGLYMTQPFLAEYSRRFEDPKGFDLGAKQTALFVQHALHPELGVVYHAWDQDCNAAWAAPKTCLSPEFWARSNGWYFGALVDVLEYMPQDHPSRAQYLQLTQKLAAGLKKLQDPETGLWYQVLDKGDRPDNWLETSATGLYVYAFKLAVDKGYIDASYLDVARRAWQGLQAHVQAEGPTITGAVQGMSVQKDYAGYVDKERLENSPHGLVAIQLAASQMEY